MIENVVIWISLCAGLSTVALVFSQSKVPSNIILGRIEHGSIVFFDTLLNFDKKFFGQKIISLKSFNKSLYITILFSFVTFPLFVWFIGQVLSEVHLQDLIDLYNQSGSEFLKFLIESIPDRSQTLNYIYTIIPFVIFTNIIIDYISISFTRYLVKNTKYVLQAFIYLLFDLFFSVMIAIFGVGTAIELVISSNIIPNFDESFRLYVYFLAIVSLPSSLAMTGWLWLFSLGWISAELILRTKVIFQRAQHFNILAVGFAMLAVLGAPFAYFTSSG